jgi:hypothetical protein
MPDYIPYLRQSDYPGSGRHVTIYVNEIGTLRVRYSGFKSEAEANSWVAEQQKHPDLPPFRSGI